MLVALGGALVAVNAVSNDNARKTITTDLISTANLFHKSFTERGRILLEKARLLSSDFAFKQAFATGDHGTLLSALVNHQARVRADMMMLLSLDNVVLAQTLDPDRHDIEFANSDLLEAVMASDNGEIESIQRLKDNVYQIVVVPLFTPEPSALIVIGFLMDDDFAADLSHTTNETEVSLLYQDDPNAWQVFASTLIPKLSSQLPAQVAHASTLKDQTVTLLLAEQKYISKRVPFDKHGLDAIALLQRSLDKQLSVYRRLRQTLLIIFGMVISGSIIAAVLMSKSVVRPVKALQQGAEQISSGNLEYRLAVDRQDELGQLASSFNTMTKGLQERNKVRDLLGKVVSPTIAEELMKKEIQLGGEEREVTVLFSDVRGFTALCEHRSPQEIVKLLNTYLTRINTEIEQYNGVVDKYIGDAVMALFGAPLNDAKAADHAVGAGLAMLQAVKTLSDELSGQGTAKLKIGIGVHTGIVVAGNMGSATRLNYTVIGDGVNLASRLEGLCKFYGVDMIVSEVTQQKADGFIFRELDRVCVKGKEQPITIFEPLGVKDVMTRELAAEVEQYQSALEAYRRRDWQLAYAVFSNLSKLNPKNMIYNLYRIRVEEFINNPPGPEWSDVYIHHQK